MRTAIIVLMTLLTGSLAMAQDQAPSNSYRPAQGYVPDAATDIRIAVAVWEPIYGKQKIASEQPYVASLLGDVWTVVGTLHCTGVCVGGVASAKISKRDGTILKVIHGM
jgi:hypothetical protein